MNEVLNRRPAPVSFVYPDEEDMRLHAKPGQFMPEFRFKVGDYVWMTFTVLPRQSTYHRRKTRQDQAIDVWQNTVDHSSERRSSVSIFRKLHYFGFDAAPFIDGLLFMGWEPALIGRQQREAIQLLQEHRQIEVPYTLCMACGATGKEVDETDCLTCQGLGGYALYDEEVSLDAEPKSS